MSDLARTHASNQSLNSISIHTHAFQEGGEAGHGEANRRDVGRGRAQGKGIGEELHPSPRQAKPAQKRSVYLQERDVISRGRDWSVKEDARAAARLPRKAERIILITYFRLAQRALEATFAWPVPLGGCEGEGEE
jgi:hypothetical protein